MSVELSGASVEARTLDNGIPLRAAGGRLRGYLRFADRQAAVAVAIHIVSLAFAGVVVMWLNRRQWFFGDEWEFVANRLRGAGRALLAPHNEHWSTGPILIYRGLYAVFGLRSYLPYVAVLVTFHLLATHLLWRLLRRADVAPLIASALAAVFSVLGAGSENLLWAFQIGFVASVALGLLHILLVDHDGPFDRRDRAAWGVGMAALTFSGISVTMLAMSGLVVLIRRGVKSALYAVAPPAAVYAVWFVWVGHEGLKHQDRGVDLVLAIPTYVWTGLSSALERSSGLPGAGSTLVILLVVGLLVHHAGRAAAAPTAMAVGAVLLFAVLSIGRSAQGIDQATSGRYVYIAIALLLPSVGILLSHPAVRPAPRQAVVLVIVGFVLLNGLGALRLDSRNQGDREVQMRHRILAAADLVSSRREVVATLPEPMYSPDLTVTVLERLLRDKALPVGLHIPEPDVLAAAGDLQVALVPAPPSNVGGPVAGRPVITGVGVVVDRDGCAALTTTAGMPAHAEVRIAAPTAMPVRSVAGGELEVALRSADDPNVVGPSRTFALAPGETSWLHVARIGPMSLTMPPGSRLCGVQAAPG